MYSRQKKYQSEPARPQSDYLRDDLRVPPNYSGVAFDGGLVQPQVQIQAQGHSEETPPKAPSDVQGLSMYLPELEGSAEQEPPRETHTADHGSAAPSLKLGVEELLIVGIALLMLGSDLSADAVWLFALLLL